MGILDTGVKNVRNVERYIIGTNSISDLPTILNSFRIKSKNDYVVFFIDQFFKNENDVVKKLKFRDADCVIYVSSLIEPTTNSIDRYVDHLNEIQRAEPAVIVGMGGGITMDVAKAVSNLLTNGGLAENYQGWDLVKEPGVYKIGIPTISGTGAEATRTCVMTNERSGLKLGMNSDYTVYDQIIMDPSLSKTVPRDQYFYTGMDAFIHCFESLRGSYRNAIGDAFSAQAIELCKDVFSSDDMMTNENRSKLMVASYLGGSAIATSYVGLVHPISAGLSVNLGIHHCLANCITMRAMQEFYPNEYEWFWSAVDKQNVFIPHGICKSLGKNEYKKFFESIIIHEKPLTNALGKNFRDILTFEKTIEILLKM